MASSIKKVLSIDGGGIRGIIPGQIMVEIENEFGIKTSDYFDLIAGTSTGGILACAYLCPDPEDPIKPKFKKAEDVVALYLEEGDEIFEVPFWHKVRTMGGVTDEKYPEEGLEDALQLYFGDAELKDLLKPCVVTSYDIRRRGAHFFKQQKAKNDANRNFYVRDVARATSAAPTYFEAAQVKSMQGRKFPLIDGGVFVNNPSMVAYAEGRKVFKNGKAKAEDMKVLSLGTGFTKKAYYHRDAKNWGAVQWIKPVIDIMMSGGAEVTDYQIRKIYETTTKPQKYLRIDESLQGTGIDPDMDCATPENMEKLKQFGKQLFQNNKTKISDWLKL